MPPVWIPFDGWSPGGGFFGDGWELTTNLYPSEETWRPWRKFVPAAGSVAFTPITGAYAHTWSSGIGTASFLPDDATIFAGSNTRLFTVAPATGVFTDVSRAAFYAAAGTPGGWRFASVGNDIWATNWLDAMQRRVNNAGVFTNGVVSTFAPIPRFLATVREHLVVANLANGGRFQDELAWSDADDATNFDPPAATSTSLAASKRLTSIPGQITGLIGGQYGLAFKSRAIYYLEYTGTSQVFRPDVLSPHIGTVFPASIINCQYGLFFLGNDGFYRIKGLAEPEKISPPGLSQRMREAGVSAARLPFTATEAWRQDLQIVGFRAPGRPLIGWLYTQSQGFFAGNDKILLHNPESGAWSEMTIDVGPTVSTVVERPAATIVDEALAAFTFDNPNSRFAPLAGLGDATTIKAPSLALRYRPANIDKAQNTYQQSIIKGVLPVFSTPFAPFDAPAITASVTVRSALNPFQTAATATETRPATERDPISGFYPFQIAGRFFRIAINCTAEDFKDFVGMWVDQELLR